MMSTKHARLQQAAHYVADQRARGTTEAAIVAGLVTAFGGTARFDRDPYTLCVCGVRSSSTWSKDTALLSGWLRNARLALSRAGMTEQAA